MNSTQINNQKDTFYEEHYYEDFYLDFIEYMSLYYKRAFKNPEKCVFIDSGVPSEMVMAMGLTPVMIEIIPTLLTSVQSSEDILNTADKYFFNTGTCSFSRFALPAFDKGYIPLPKAFVCTTVCKDMSNNITMIAQKYNVPYYCIDIPYKNNEESIEYLTKQYKDFFDFLVKVSGEKLDLERVRKTLENSAESLEYMKKALELRKSKPALFFGGQMLKFRNINFLRGSEETVKISKELYELMKFRSTAHITPVKNEKIRILWNGSSPLYAREFFSLLEKKMGAVIVADPLCCFSYLDNFLEDQDPIKSLARLMLSNPLGGNNGKILIQKVKEYNVDGVIHFGQLNCNVINSKTWLIKNELIQARIPFLELNGDLVDQRNSGIEQIMTRLEAFIEMLTQ